MFGNKFVRVESLAIEQAYRLRDEAGQPNLYLSKSELFKEEGQALADALREQKPAPEEHGLYGEIEAFSNPPFDSFDVFLRRWYHFLFNDPRSHKPALWIWVGYEKMSRERDWDLSHETVFQTDDEGKIPLVNKALIYRVHV